MREAGSVGDNHRGGKEEQDRGTGRTRHEVVLRRDA